MNNKEEILQISLGSIANSITSHLLNLQGLACTSEHAFCEATKTHTTSSSSQNSTYVPRVLFVDGCDSFEVRQQQQQKQQVVVQDVWNDGVQQQQQSSQSMEHTNQNATTQQDEYNFMSGWNAISTSTSTTQQQQQQQQQEVAWDGKIDIFQAQTLPTQPQEEENPFDKFQNAASLLSSHTSSRYNAPKKHTYTSHSSNSRHMTWDSDDDSDDEDEEEDEEMKQRRLYLAQQRQYQSIQNATETLQSTWKDIIAEKNELQNQLHWSQYWMYPHPSYSSYALPLPFSTLNHSSSSSSSPSNNNYDAVGCLLSSFRAGYDTSSSSSSFCSELNSTWRELVVSEQVRKILEESDHLRGVSTIVDNGINSNVGFYTGLTSSILQELKDECKGLITFVSWIYSPLNDDDVPETEKQGESGSSTVTDTKRQVEKYRRGIAQGLSLSTLSEVSNVILPICLPSNMSTFQSSAIVASLLECSTLPYRLSTSSSSSSSSCIGLKSGLLSGGSGPYETCSSLHFSEFVSTLKPSERHVVLELDALYAPLSSSSTTTTTTTVSPALALANALSSSSNGESNESSLKSKLLQGTSIERQLRQQQEEEYRRRQKNASVANTSSSYKQRRRMQQLGRTPDVEPGLWCEDVTDGGILTSFSPTTSSFQNQATGTNKVLQRRGRGNAIIRRQNQHQQNMKRTRSLHHHFALSSSFRPPSPPPETLSFASFLKKSKSSNNNGPKKDAISTYLTPMMESLGIRYRPEISSSVIVPQSIHALTRESTAAGIYWPSIFSSSSFTHEKEERTAAAAASSHIHQTPILSLLGNTTRSYPLLQSIVQEYNYSLNSTLNRGYYTKDVSCGLVPEVDDCEDSMEICRTIMDCYEPPSGSGVLGNVSSEDEDEYWDDVSD